MRQRCTQRHAGLVAVRALPASTPPPPTHTRGSGTAVGIGEAFRDEGDPTVAATTVTRRGCPNAATVGARRLLTSLARRHGRNGGNGTRGAHAQRREERVVPQIKPRASVRGGGGHTGPSGCGRVAGACRSYAVLLLQL